MYWIWGKWFISSVSLEKKKIYAPNNDQSLQCTSERLTETLRSPWITDDRRGEDLQTRQPGSTRSEGTVNVFFSDALSH